MVEEVVKEFTPSSKSDDLVDVVFSPGEYLVFAVFARDVRSATKTDDHMTLEEVLACFEEPAGQHVPQDSDFQRHTSALVERKLLVRDDAGNFRLIESLHGFAR